MSKLSVACGILMVSQLFCFTAINAANPSNVNDWSSVNAKFRDRHCPPANPNYPQNYLDECSPKKYCEQGPTGPTGPQGATGPAGPQGRKGERGKEGERGERGERGCRGEKGEKGEKGCPGERGKQGEKGCHGEKGEKGCHGEKGEKGCKGDPGPQGPAGPQGIAGDNGENGLNGLNGARGPTGATGPAGPTGAADTIVGTVAFQATYQGLVLQTVDPGELVTFNTLNNNQHGAVIALPGFPAATEFVLPADSVSLYLVTYGIALNDTSVFPGSFYLQLLDPPAIPVPTPVIGSTLGLNLISPDVLSSVTCFVVTTGTTPTLSVISSPSQPGPAIIGMPNGETSALISITKLQ